MRLGDLYARNTFAKLPDDVKAIISLLSDDYKLYAGVDGNYIDIFNDAANCYLFEMTPFCTPDRGMRIFCLWVRAGMPAGFESHAEDKIDLLEGSDAL